MARFVVDFAKLGREPYTDGRLDAPAFHRNCEPIWSAIERPLRASASGNVLEIGSGTGQHAIVYASRVPHLVWWPSDILPSHLASIEAWRQAADVINLQPPQSIDLTQPRWTWRGNNTEPLVAILCINVLHIAPAAATENLISGAARLLAPGGHLFVYGPFKRAGAHTAASNLEFDESLRAKNPEWGVRDVDELNHFAQIAGLPKAKLTAMPANNLALAFTRP